MGNTEEKGNQHMAKTQVLSFPVRLPDALQADALRLLDASREAINALVVALWERLDDFVAERTGPAWKQVEQYALQRSGHGSRQERCEMEQAGRILRAHAARKQMFLAILPLLSEGLILPADEKRPARKDHRVIRERVRDLRDEMEEADTFLGLVNVVEQACNVYLATGTFPTTYEAMQPVPLLHVGHLTYAGDDGMAAGQTYRIQRQECGPTCDCRTHAERPAGQVWWVRLRGPTDAGEWRWPAQAQQVFLPPAVSAYLAQDATPLAPTLRELADDAGQRVVVLDVSLEVPARLVPPLEQERRVLGFDWGIRQFLTLAVIEPGTGEDRYQQVSRPVFLDTGGLDGRQARLRREIDRLKACQEKYQRHITAALQDLDAHQTPVPAHFPGWQAKVAGYQRRIQMCWATYSRRNRELAHLGANVLILVALLYDCHLICGENLKSLRVQGRGKGVRGRFQHWRINSQVRGELWRVLKYKCHLLGIRTRQEQPKATSHTCAHCGQPAHTFRSPAHRQQAVDWGVWLWCGACGWNGSRDYAASLNIARLGMAFLTTSQRSQRYTWYRMTSAEVKPVSYSGTGARLLLPVQGSLPRPVLGKKVSYAGWRRSTALRTSQPRALLTVLSTSACRRQILQQALTVVA
jgi:putative transposase